MKVGMVSEFYNPLPGGISEHIHSLSRELSLLGHEVVVVTGRQRDRVPPGSPRVLHIGNGLPVRYNGSVSRISFGWRLGRQLRRAFQQERFDVVHVHNPLMPTLPLLSVREADCPVVATLHSNYPRDLLVELFRPYLRRRMRHVDVFVPVSLAACHAFGKCFPGDFRIIPNGVDFDGIARMSALAEPYRSIPDRRLRIVFVGALVPRKGLPVLVDAFIELRRRGVTAELEVIGGGPESGRVHRQVPRSLRDQVRFTGLATRHQVIQGYVNADVFCAPGLGRESFGIVLLEAMAAGLPVVASDIEGYRDVVTHGVEGILVPPGDPRALADSLESLLANADERRRLGNNGQVKARRLRWKAIAGRLEEIYREVVAARQEDMPRTQSRSADRRSASIEQEWSH